MTLNDVASAYQELIQVAGHRPGIINICHAAEGESVIPVLDVQLILFSETLLFQSMEDLFLCKAKCCGILVRGGSDHIQIIQVGEYRFFADPGDPCHDRSFERWICFECVVEHGSYK